jgi:hypothetical protein
MAMVFNPTTESLTENLTLPLYYSGLTDAVEVSVGGAAATKVSFHSEGRTTLDDQAMHQSGLFRSRRAAGFTYYVSR